jgi:hypothetical protein
MPNMSSVRVPRWLSSALLLAIAVPLLVVAPAPASRADGTVHYGVLRSSLTKVTSSTGAHLFVRVTGSKDFDEEGGGYQASVELLTAAHTESHTWQPSTPYGSSRDFDYTDDGYATVTPATTPYFSVDLQFAPTSKASTVCGSADAGYQETRWTGQLSGMLFVDTHSKRWGTIGSNNREDFTFAPGSTLRVGRGDSNDVCARGVNPCPRRIAVYDYVGERIFAATSQKRNGRMHGHLQASRAKKMPDAAVRRLDLVRVPAPPMTLKLRNHRPTVFITTSGGGATGNAKVTVKRAESTYHPRINCPDGSHRRSTAWSGATLTNGATRLDLHTQVFGDLLISDTTTADIDYVRK